MFLCRHKKGEAQTRELVQKILRLNAISVSRSGRKEKEKDNCSSKNYLGEKGKEKSKRHNINI